MPFMSLQIAQIRAERERQRAKTAHSGMRLPSHTPDSELDSKHGQERVKSCSPLGRQASRGLHKDYIEPSHPPTLKRNTLVKSPFEVEESSATKEKLKLPQGKNPPNQSDTRQGSSEKIISTVRPISTCGESQNSKEVPEEIKVSKMNTWHGKATSPRSSFPTISEEAPPAIIQLDQDIENKSDAAGSPTPRGGGKILLPRRIKPKINIDDTHCLKTGKPAPKQFDASTARKSSNASNRNNSNASIGFADIVNIAEVQNANRLQKEDPDSGRKSSSSCGKKMAISKIIALNRLVYCPYHKSSIY